SWLEKVKCSSLQYKSDRNIPLLRRGGIRRQEDDGVVFAAYSLIRLFAYLHIRLLAYLLKKRKASTSEPDRPRTSHPHPFSSPYLPISPSPHLPISHPPFTPHHPLITACTSVSGIP